MNQYEISCEHCTMDKQIKAQNFIKTGQYNILVVLVRPNWILLKKTQSMTKSCMYIDVHSRNQK